MVGGRGVRLRHVLATLAATSGLGYLLVRWWDTQSGGLPRPSWVSVLLLFFMAAGVLFAGLPVRRTLRGTAATPVNPLRAFRTVVLAQASALTGALVAGWYVAHLLVLWPDRTTGTTGSMVALCGALAASGVILVAVGLWVQSWCRIDPPADDQVDATPAD